MIQPKARRSKRRVASGGRESQPTTPGARRRFRRGRRRRGGGAAGAGDARRRRRRSTRRPLPTTRGGSCGDAVGARGRRGRCAVAVRRRRLLRRAVRQREHRVALRPWLTLRRRERWASGGRTPAAYVQILLLVAAARSRRAVGGSSAAHTSPIRLDHGKRDDATTESATQSPSRSACARGAEVRRRQPHGWSCAASVTRRERRRGGLPLRSAGDSRVRRSGLRSARRRPGTQRAACSSRTRRQSRAPHAAQQRRTAEDCDAALKIARTRRPAARNGARARPASASRAHAQSSRLSRTGARWEVSTSTRVLARLRRLPKAKVVV